MAVDFILAWKSAIIRPRAKIYGTPLHIGGEFRMTALRITACFALAAFQAGRAQVSVTTYHNDNARTGQNLHEWILTPANANSNEFGRVFVQPVDGYIYAQPLYVPNVSIGGKTHNVVFVATENGGGWGVWGRLTATPATPVIDTSTGTLYVVANTKENGAFFQRLHALD